MSTPMFSVGLDVHKDSVTIAVFRDRDRESMRAMRPRVQAMCRDELDRKIETLALVPRYKPVVDRITCLRGFKTQAAMVLATELGDLRRFESPRQLMAYIGLVPTSTHRGTDDGSGPSPRPAMHACAMYSSRPHGTIDDGPQWAPHYGAGRRARILRFSPMPGNASTVYKVFHRLAAKKSKQVAATAVARESTSRRECPGHDRRTPQNIMGSGYVPNPRG